MSGIDYEVEYNNRARVPENPALMAGWARDSAAYREQHPPRRLSYGPGSRNVIDLFEGNGDGPLVVFIHGGYWQALDGSSSRVPADSRSRTVSSMVPHFMRSRKTSSGVFPRR